MTRKKQINRKARLEADVLWIKNSIERQEARTFSLLNENSTEDKLRWNLIRVLEQKQKSIRGVTYRELMVLFHLYNDTITNTQKEFTQNEIIDYLNYYARKPYREVGNHAEEINQHELIQALANPNYKPKTLYKIVRYTNHLDKPSQLWEHYDKAIYKGVTYRYSTLSEAKIKYLAPINKNCYEWEQINPLDTPYRPVLKEVNKRTWPTPEEVKEKMSRAKQGRKYDERHKDNMRITQILRHSKRLEQCPVDRIISSKNYSHAHKFRLLQILSERGNKKAQEEKWNFT